MKVYKDPAEEAAAKANEQIKQERIAYHYTMAPLQDINDTLKDIKLLLNDILVLLKKRV